MVQRTRISPQLYARVADALGDARDEGPGVGDREGPFDLRASDTHSLMGRWARAVAVGLSGDERS